MFVSVLMKFYDISTVFLNCFVVLKQMFVKYFNSLYLWKSEDEYSS